MTAKQGAAAATPRLRFPEYRKAQPWLVKRFDQLLTIGSGRDYKHLGPGDIPVYGSGGYMLSVDDYLYEGESVCIGRKGTIDRPVFLSGKFWTVDTLFYTHSFTDCLPRFVFLHFQNIDWKKHNEAGGVPSLSKTNIEKIEVAVPSIAEQQKIADCLTSVDEVIAAQGRKVEALKAYKRGLMQQLFPREGETRPRLRFPEFRNIPQWKETPLGELVDLLSGFPFDGKDIVEDSTGERLMRGINITEGVIRHNDEMDRYYLGTTEGLEKYRLAANDLVIGMDGSKVGKNSALVTEKDAGALLVQRVARLRAKSLPLINFIFHQIHSPRFHSYVDRINTSSGIPHISAMQIKEYSIHSTSELEQQRIADCLSSLDSQITAESNQLVTLKAHKQGLMQQLFPAPESASA